MQKPATPNAPIVRENSNSSLSLKKIGEMITSSETKMDFSKETQSKRTFSPIATQRTVVITRTNYQEPMSVITKSFNHDSMMASGAGKVTGEVGHFKRDRENDKKDMQILNEKLAGYIDQVRFLETQNKQQAGELSNLKDKWGRETEEVKNMYSIELDNLKKLLNDAEKNRSKLEIDLNNLETELKKSKERLEISRQTEDELRSKIEKCEADLSEAEGLISMLKKRIANLEEQRAKDKKEILRLREEIQMLQTDLNQVTMKYLNADCDLQGKKDELEFLKQVHQAELNELSALAYRDTTKENKDFWKSEIAVAMQDIQSDYDERLQMLRSTIESQFVMKMQDVKSENSKLLMELNSVRDENKRIKTDWGSYKSKIPDLENKIISLERALADLQHEIDETKRDHEFEIINKTKDITEADALIQELQTQKKTLLDDKLSLQLEIAAYRKLLEGEETRWMDRNHTLVVKENGSMNSIQKDTANLVQQENIISKKIQETTTSSISEISSKSTFSRTTKGNIAIQECSTDGRCVILENTSNKKEEIGDYGIHRDIDHGKQLIKFIIPKKTTIDPNKTIKIWAKGFKPPGGISDFEISETNWGIGFDIHTTLINGAGEEKATYTQKTVTVKKGM